MAEQNLKTFLKKLIEIADTGIYELRGTDKLSEEEKEELTTTIAGIQNSLGGELEGLLKKYNLEWK
jgi:hypothetical protein